MKGAFVWHVPYIGLSVLVFFLTLWLAKNGSRLVEDAWARTPSHRSTAKFLGRFAFGSTLLLGTGLALGISGINASVFVGAATFAIGFGLRSWFENLVAGVVIATSKIFDVKSFVGAAGGTGTVLEIGAMDTVLKKLSNQTIRMPNASLLREPMILYAAYPERLMRFETWTGVDADPARVIAILEGLLEGRDELITTPEPPMALFTNMTGGFLTFELRYWVRKDRVKKLLEYKTDMRQRIVAALEAAGYDMPYATTTLQVNAHDSGALAIRG